MTSSIAVTHNNVGTTQSKLCHRISLADQSYVADMSVLSNEQIMPTVGRNSHTDQLQWLAASLG